MSSSTLPQTPTYLQPEEAVNENIQMLDTSSELPDVWSEEAFQEKVDMFAHRISAALLHGSMDTSCLVEGLRFELVSGQ